MDEDAEIGKETVSAQGSGTDRAGDAFLTRRCRDIHCWKLPPSGALGSSAAAASEATFGEFPQPASNPAARRREELRRAGTGAGEGLGGNAPEN